MFNFVNVKFKIDLVNKYLTPIYVSRKRAFHLQKLYPVCTKSFHSYFFMGSCKLGTPPIAITAVQKCVCVQSRSSWLKYFLTSLKTGHLNFENTCQLEGSVDALETWFKES